MNVHADIEITFGLMSTSSIQELISEITALIGEGHVLQEEQLANRYEHIWTMETAPTAPVMVLPETTEELSKICALCYRHEQAMVLFGGLTNLVGGTKTKAHDLIISMERMNQIEEVNLQTSSITVGAGAILEQVQEAARDAGLSFPVNFGAKGSAQIGGAISTNAGGLRVIRYGMMRQQVLGLEVVLPDGRVLSSLKEIVKDNSGIDLKQLFIGSEGILGIVTKAVLKLIPKSISQDTAYVAMDSFDQVTDFLRFMEKGLAGRLSAYDLILDDCYACLSADETPWNPPVEYGHKYYVMVDQLGGDIVQDQAHFQSLIESAFEEGLILDAAIADGAADRDWFWNLREDVSILSKSHPFSQHFDVSLPVHAMGQYLDDTKAQLLAIDGVESAYAFGHVADGNMHYIVGKANDSQALKDEINRVVYEPLQNLKGSVSAEHGIGLDKRAYLHISKSEAEIDMMRQLKTLFDPKGLLNPGRIVAS